ncbi:hypothetical protein EQG41_21275 [Billgrantia azerbaijanica]|nr:hypothetical protein EQG41_21275 [Halomonas azerbaijanica]
MDFFATGFFLDVDDLEVDAFLFGIVTIIALTDFDLPGWNTGRRLVVLRLLLGWSLLRELGLVVRVAEACFAGAGACCWFWAYSSAAAGCAVKAGADAAGCGWG